MTRTLAREATVEPTLDLTFGDEAKPEASSGAPSTEHLPCRSRGSWPPDGWPRDGWPPPELLPERYWNAAMWEST